MFYESHSYAYLLFSYSNFSLYKAYITCCVINIFIIIMKKISVIWRTIYEDNFGNLKQYYVIVMNQCL